MPYVKNDNHKLIPFSSETPPRADFYIYYNVDDLAAKCEGFKEDLFKCRTVGILESANGKFYLKDMDDKPEAGQIQVSMKYIKTQIKSTYSPLPVQVIGTMQWKKRPVLFAHILQDITPDMAERLKKAMSGATSLHLAEDVQTEKET